MPQTSASGDGDQLESMSTLRMSRISKIEL